MKYVRHPEGDRRIARGDDFAGDCWQNTETNELRYVAVGRDPNAGALPLVMCSRCRFVPGATYTGPHGIPLCVDCRDAYADPADSQGFVDYSMEARR